MPRRRMAGAVERRKCQNAEAQRVYRAKQKERVRALERIAVSALLGKDSPSHHQSTEPDAPLCLPGRLSPGPHTPGSVSLTTTEIYQSLTPSTKQENSKCFKLVVVENFTFRDIVKYGLISIGYAMHPALFDRALTTPPYKWIGLLKSYYGDVDMRQVISSGVRVLAQLNGPEEWPTAAWFVQPRANICTNSITLKSMSYCTALIANALQLKFGPEFLMGDDAQSTFCTPDWERGELQTDESTMGIAPDLVPTAVQRSLPHHPVIDLIPWPSFRTKCILAMSMDPPMIDEDDLCLDAMGGGLRCWGSTMGSMNGRGQGAPWDARSWEAMPWFLEKWAVLLGGPDSEISRSSAWWRSMQGVHINSRVSTN